MRKVAPDRAGSAASQNNCSGVKAKPMAGSFATTMDQTIHTEKASVSAGMESHKLRRAILRPAFTQKDASSGRQSSMMRGMTVRPST